MKTTIRVAGGILIFFAGLTTIAYFYAFEWSRPSFSPRYFTAELAAKYDTLDAAFEGFDTALVNRDAALYEEALGRPMTPNEQQKFRGGSFPMGRSRVVRRETKKDIAFLVTDGNAGEFFEFIGGRWVFTPEDLAANMRLLFRTFGL
ncbi:MAG: hypothetical protein OEW05_05650 [Candidatus Aminicenantes bacterium]|nr:hypothetical protein [Candidatus Aminicenantes bacterium]